MRDHRLDYYPPRRREGSLMAGRAALLAILSVMCAAALVVGFVMNPGEGFLVAGVLVSLVGMTLAIVGIVVDRRTVLVCSIVLSVHVLVEAFFAFTFYLSLHC
jgi:hypothetical protein